MKQPFIHTLEQVFFNNNSELSVGLLTMDNPLLVTSTLR